MAEKHLVIKNLYKSFGKNEVLHDINLEIEKGLFTTFLGPSGCGKTTLLRSIAGFYDIEKGTISIGGNVINNIPTHLRNTTMVFQDYALFPHLSIKKNICYGLEIKKMDPKLIKQRLDKTISYLDIGNLLDRFPSQLSGGQQQRVALARALVMEPEVLLLDEPLSNLDAKLRINIRAELRQLQKKLGITTIYVTHDQGEALALSDKIAVMNKGKILQYDSSQNIYFSPSNDFTASFIGSSNILDGNVYHEDQTVLFQKNEFKFEIQNKYNDGFGKLCIRPETIEIVEKNDTKKNVFKGKIINNIFEGSIVRYWVEALGQIIIVDKYNPGYQTILDGDVFLYFDPEKLHVMQNNNKG
jgi:ABC-type Fe3+/spermidine/putrescine transport system ATPase subunit